MHRRIVVGIAAAASRSPFVTLAIALLAMVLFGSVARRLEVRSDLLELLPRDSPGVRAFEHQLGRVGGGGALIIIAESPDRLQNERFIDALATSLDRLQMEATRCAPDARPGACPGRLIAYTEASTRDVRAFYETNKWLYADIVELQAADDERRTRQSSGRWRWSGRSTSRPGEGVSPFLWICDSGSSRARTHRGSRAS